MACSHGAGPMGLDPPLDPGNYSISCSSSVTRDRPDRLVVQNPQPLGADDLRCCRRPHHPPPRA